MKYVILALIAFMLPLQALAIHVRSPMMRLDIDTPKIITIAGEINDDMALSVEIQQRATSDLAGPRIVLINSPGGNLASGARIIAMLNQERRMGVKTVCVIINNAHSMAFDIATQACDVRLATAGSTMLVHKAAFGPGACEGVPRCTAKNLRKAADDVEKADEANSSLNQIAMHMTRSEYDHYADAETRWQAVALLVRGWLHGMAILNP